ncbi:MAG: hypothetical protein VKL39_17055 [Leptolyngbyaceae bacterium]|nr:hypothetical protein [Leptolyngbyaceae bacterium]
MDSLSLSQSNAFSRRTYVDILTADSDGDTIINAIDLDDDNDGISDKVETETAISIGTTPTVIEQIFIETFGQGLGRASFASAGLTGTTSYLYEHDRWVQDGDYALVSTLSTDQGNWWASKKYNSQDLDFTDHTGDLNGRFMMVNASYSPGEFYRQKVTVPAFGLYSASAFLASANERPIDPDVTIQIEDGNGNILVSTHTGSLPGYTNKNSAWQKYTLDTFLLTLGEVSIVFINNAPGGNGNDLFLDDISFSAIEVDTDGDGIYDALDLDSDNDGISDLLESGQDPTLDIDNDGIRDDMSSDAVSHDIDRDGLADAVDALNSGQSNEVTTGALVIPINTDQFADILPDYLDLDADNDGIPDKIEAQATKRDISLHSMNEGDSRLELGGSHTSDNEGDSRLELEGSHTSDNDSLPQVIEPLNKDAKRDDSPDNVRPRGVSTMGSHRSDYLIGTEQNDILNGFSDVDVLRGDAGDDIINGGSSRDTLHGGMGNDLLNGGSNHDDMHGGSGNDILNGGSGNDWMFGQQGRDILNGGTGRDRIFGADGRDLINGSNARDRLYGEKGRDKIQGGRGNDIIVGGWGKDILTGGQGGDRFVYESVKDIGDLITDFEILKDKLDLRKINGISSLDDVFLMQRENDLVVKLHTNQGMTKLATLTDVDVSTINSQHFIF